ncbi:MAG TPA: efflux RND transporter periplasmic adaptor subunit [Thermoanaerobaculia bacterium]|nr:efflux RND transporter periplasmic adaptor subunit [Thermoanaerobaculia bacterium]
MSLLGPGSARRRARTVSALPLLLLVLLGALLAAGCGDAGADAGGGGERQGGRGPERGGGGGFPGGGFPGAGGGGGAGIPVEVAEVVRRDISDLLQTTGTLEAEQEVDVVARIAGPIVELRVEEGDRVRAGGLLARIDDRELRAQLEILRVAVDEARANHERAQASFEAQIISKETLDQTSARFESATAQIRGTEIQLGYTQVLAPFDGLVIERAVKLQEFVQNGVRLFRVSDFDPLLCPVQIPEKDLGRIRLGQSAYLTVEAFPGDRFAASVLRINPVVERGSGTVKVTLAVRGEGRLRPGMFASVHLRTDIHQDAVVIPKRALVLESIGDTVYVLEDGVARRREVSLGYDEADLVEVISGLQPGERVIVVGQDSVSEGTPAYELAARVGPTAAQRGEGAQADAAVGGEPPASAGTSGGPGARAGGQQPGAPGGSPGGGFREIDWNDPAAVERVKAMMRQRGLTDSQIEERLERMKAMGTGGRPGRS